MQRKIDRSVETKKKNILHHNVEADFFEIMHPEGSSFYERLHVSRCIDSIRASSSSAGGLCVDIGCGTGFATCFELPLYDAVVGIDISRRMLEVAMEKLKRFQ